MSIDYFKNKSSDLIDRYTVPSPPNVANSTFLNAMELSGSGYEVSLETSGALDIAPVDARVHRVMDLKTPGSGEVSRNLWANLAALGANDQVKFVICSRADYDWARDVICRENLASRCEVLISPSHAQVDPTALADWIVRDRLPVRFQLQLHKVLWGNQPGR